MNRLIEIPYDRSTAYVSDRHGDDGYPRESDESKPFFLPLSVETDGPNTRPETAGVAGRLNALAGEQVIAPVPHR